MYSTENQLSRNEMWCAADNRNYMSHICAKGFSDSILNQPVIEYQNQQNCPKFHIFIKIDFFKKYDWKEIGQLLGTCKCYDRDM